MDNVEDLVQQKLNHIRESHRLLADRSALLVVDMQHGFLDEGASLEVPAGRTVLPNVARLVEGCRRAGVPVIFTEFVYATQVPCLRGDPFGPEHLPAAAEGPVGFGHPSSNCLVGKRAGAGPESADTVDQLAPLENELVIRAHTYDKFYGTPLDLALRSRNVDRLMVTGVTTDVCVNSTIIAATTRNYRATAITDGMATIHEHIHNACLQIWENKFARLCSTEDALEEIAGNA